MKPTGKILRSTVLLSGLLCSGVWQAPAESAERKPVCAVAGFKNTSGAASSRYYSDLIQQSLAFEIARMGDWVLAERACLRDVLTENDLKAAGLTVGAARPLVSADVVVVGEYDSGDGLITIHARLVNVQGGAVARQARWKGHVSSLADRMPRQIVAELAGRPPEPEGLSPKAEASLREAATALDARRPEQAIELCDRVLEEKRQYVPAILLRGWAQLERKGQADRAKRDFRKVLELEGSNVAARLGLVHAELQADDSLAARRALPVLEEVLSARPEHGEALWLSSLVYLRLQQKERALDSARKATASLPHYAPAWAALAEVCRLQKDLGGARTAAEKAVACDERRAAHWMMLGDIQLSEGRKVEARKSFSRGLACDPAPETARMLKVRLQQFE